MPAFRVDNDCRIISRQPIHRAVCENDAANARQRQLHPCVICSSKVVSNYQGVRHPASVSTGSVLSETFMFVRAARSLAITEETKSSERCSVLRMRITRS